MSLDKRHENFEKKSAQDDEFTFKIRSRRASLLGYWAAKKLGLSEEKFEKYANSVILADLEEPGDQDFIRKIKYDFEQAGVNISEHEIKRESDYLYEKAKEQLNSET